MTNMNVEDTAMFDNCSRHTEGELKQFCKFHRVRGYTKMEKDDLVKKCCLNANEHIQTELKRLIELEKRVTFVTNVWDTVDDEEALGIMVSNFTRWTPENIVKVSIEALGDANAGSFAGELDDSWKKWKRDKGF